jgi:hypothetical protein
MKITLIMPGVGRKPGQSYVRSWKMEPLAPAMLAALTPPDIEAIVAAGREDLSKVLGPDGERTIREDTARHYPRYARLGDRILANFVQFLKVY